MARLPKGFRYTGEGMALNKPRPEGRPIAASLSSKKSKPRKKKAKRK